MSKKRKDNSHPEGSIDEHLDMNELSEIVILWEQVSFLKNILITYLYKFPS